MEKTLIVVTVYTLMMKTSAHVDRNVGRHNLSNNSGLVTLKPIIAKKMTIDDVYVRAMRESVILATAL